MRIPSNMRIVQRFVISRLARVRKKFLAYTIGLGVLLMISFQGSEPYTEELVPLRSPFGRAPLQQDREWLCDKNFTCIYRSSVRRKTFASDLQHDSLKKENEQRELYGISDFEIHGFNDLLKLQGLTDNNTDEILNDSKNIQGLGNNIKAKVLSNPHKVNNARNAKKAKVVIESKTNGADNPQIHIDCITRLAEPYLAQIENVREKASDGKKYVMFQPPGPQNPVLEANNEKYFSEIAKYNNINTILFNASMKEIESCLLRTYYPKYAVNNCERVLQRGKRHDQYSVPLYGMQCVGDYEESLKGESLDPSIFDVGLPQNYVQGDQVKTITYLHVVTNAIINQNGDVVTSEMRIVQQRCFMNRRGIIRPPKRRPVLKEVFTIAQYFGDGMFHGNVESVSRLALYIPFLQKYPSIHIHIKNEKHLPVYLGMFDFERSRYVSGTLRAELIYVPTGTGCCLPSLIHTQLQSFYLRQSLLNNPQRDLIILVKRSPRRHRYFAEHDAILQMLQKAGSSYGLQVWEFRDDPVPPLLEVASMFNRAVMVVAPHGAGQTNLLFSQPGVVLIEGLCFDPEDGKINLVYRNIVHVVGGIYYGYYRLNRKCIMTTAGELQEPVLYYLKNIFKDR